jgi:hypothetical protein
MLLPLTLSFERPPNVLLNWAIWERLPGLSLPILPGFRPNPLEEKWLGRVQVPGKKLEAERSSAGGCWTREVGFFGFCGADGIGRLCLWCRFLGWVRHVWGRCDRLPPALHCVCCQFERGVRPADRRRFCRADRGAGCYRWSGASGKKRCRGSPGEGMKPCFA